MIRTTWTKTAVTFSLAVALVSSAAILTPTGTVHAAQAATTAQTSQAQAGVSSQASSVISLAKSLQGKVKYVWGKNDAKSFTFDCSSFTKYVYKQAAGIDMKWGANAQYNQFPKVSKANLKPGDLIFTSVSTPGKIGHVGIYIGNGKMIHNLNPKNDVVISDINTGYWKNHYVGAARPIR